MANPNGNPGNLVPFRPGHSGNPGGKPVHARNQLSGAFLSELAEDFDQHGRAAIEECRKQSPARYLAIIASVIPKELKLEQSRALSDYSDEDLIATIEMVRGHAAYLHESEQAVHEGDPETEGLGARARTKCGSGR